ARTKTDAFEARAYDLSGKYEVEIWPVYFDLADHDQLKNAAKSITSSKRTVDVLVNNAGITFNAVFLMTPMTKVQEVFDVNFFSPFLFTQYIAKTMIRQKKGSIINIASSAGIDGNAGRSVYGASKAAVICTTKAMAAELGEFGIRANAIAPGITQTTMITSMTDKVIQDTILQTDMKRIGNPLDIANTALFLASDKSSYITGQVLRVDGGM
ncbi:SDR family NAD(P)-dependent oxidoreductase, partial [Methanoregula sp.]|uniref:SDR family NAD(P)-dependent oxidoreductase n=1 Tax=Methanoregula sp. TaxID=2052170 RepID=UPI003C74BC09